MRDVLKLLKRQTVLGWLVGAAAGALFHFLFKNWLLGLLLTQTIRVAFDMGYAYHDSKIPPPPEETTVIPKGGQQ